MNVTEIKCSNCGCPLEVTPGIPKGVCKYCGTPYVYEHKPTQSRDYVDISECLGRANQAEVAENFGEAINLYNKILSVNPSLPEALMGKAFAELTVFSIGKVNARYFAMGFNNAVQSAYNLGYNMTVFNEFILLKSWSVMRFLLNYVCNNVLQGYYSNPQFAIQTFMENLFFMHHAQIHVSNFVDSVAPVNPSQNYIDGYRELKRTIPAHCDFIIDKAREYKIYLNQQTLDGLETHSIRAKMNLKAFNKKYSLKR